MNGNIAWLQSRISEVQAFCAEERLRIESDPDNFARQLQLRSNMDHLSELQSRLHLAKAERKNEVFELRLIGNQVDNGTVPLRILGKIAGPLNDLLALAAYKTRYKREATKSVPLELEEEMDVRFAGVGHGSARLFIVGNTSPDLAGDSALEDTLESLFLLLTSDNEAFYDLAHAFGARAANKLKSLLQELEGDALSASLEWSSPGGRKYKWEGRIDEITRLRAMLDAIGEPEITEEMLYGEVFAMSKRGKIDVMKPDGVRTSVKYLPSQYQEIQSVHLGQKVSLLVERTTMLQEATGTEKHYYQLISIAS